MDRSYCHVSIRALVDVARIEIETKANVQAVHRRTFGGQSASLIGIGLGLYLPMDKPRTGNADAASLPGLLDRAGKVFGLAGTLGRELEQDHKSQGPVVVAGAKAIGCDAPFIAMPMLTALAAAIGNARRIQLKRGWTAPAILWVAIVGESGTAKTT